MISNIFTGLTDGTLKKRPSQANTNTTSSEKCLVYLIVMIVMYF